LLGCKVEGCSNSSNLIKPKTNAQKLKWIKALQLPEKKPVKRENYRVCRMHFAENSFRDPSGKFGIRQKSVVFEDAIPTKFLKAGSRFGGPKIKGSGSSSQILPGPTIFGRTQEGGHGSTRLKQVDVDTKTEYDDRQIQPGPTICGRTQEGGHGSARPIQVDVETQTEYTQTEYDDRQTSLEKKLDKLYDVIDVCRQMMTETYRQVKERSDSLPASLLYRLETQIEWLKKHKRRKRIGKIAVNNLAGSSKGIQISPNNVSSPEAVFMDTSSSEPSVDEPEIKQEYDTVDPLAVVMKKEPDEDDFYSNDLELEDNLAEVKQEQD